MYAKYKRECTPQDRTGAGTWADGEGGGERGGHALVIVSPLYLYFADMSSHVDIIHPTCLKWGYVITHRIR